MTQNTRIERKPVSRKGPLRVDPKAGFKRRWVNLNGRSYEEALELGYSVVEKDGAKGAEKNVTDPLSSAFVKTVSKVSGLKAVLMEIPADLYKENQREKQYEVDNIENSLKPEVGSLSIKKQ